MGCEDETIVAGTIATLATKVPQKGFKEALAEVRRQGRPTTLDIAEAAMEALGGAAELGKMMADDLKKLRGDHLDKDLQQFHDPDWKVIKGLYETLVKLSAERDKMVGESGDPLDGVSEDDLMAIASQAALVRIEVDCDFRKQLLSAIVPLDPEAVLDAAGEAINILESRPKVEVIDVKPSN
jgi:fructose-1-phosphate kinase PfkB-like protein